jgi:Family of unknown function (DUF6221)
MTLVEFLEARIAEDERPVRQCIEAGDDGEVGTWNLTRVLAECEAKRRIVAMAEGSEDFTSAMPMPGYAQPFHSPSVDILIRVQQLLALPYANHPDYRAEWAV